MSIPAVHPVRPILHHILWCLSPKTIDACISGFAVSFVMFALHMTDKIMGEHALPVFATPMMAGAIIFFGGPSPPPTKGFLVCTVGAWLGGFLMKVMPWDDRSELCFIVGAILIFFKLSGNFFVPTVGLATFLIADTSGRMSQPLPALKFLLTPWLLGHMILYCSAWAVSILRRRVRVSITKTRFRVTLQVAA